MIYFTSDHHFGHTNIIKYCDRPFPNVVEMNTYMLRQWNDVVKPDDTVYYVGDLSFLGAEGTRALVPTLNGTKHLLQGNHDRASKRFYLECGFATVSDRDQLHIEEIAQCVHLCHFPVPISADAVLIHGHQHNHTGRYSVKSYGQGLSQLNINVSVEPWEYRPVSLAQIIDIIRLARGLQESPHIKTLDSQPAV